MQAKAVYSGSFDPVTLGHLDVVAGTIQRHGLEKLLVCVVDSPDKSHFLTRENAAKLFMLAVPPELRTKIDIETISARDGINKSGATLRLKGVRDETDVSAESDNIRKAILSAAARGDKPLDVLWAVDKAVDEKDRVSSTRVRAILTAPVFDENELRKCVPVPVADILAQTRSDMNADQEWDAEAFNKALALRLSRYSFDDWSKPVSKARDEHAAPQRQHAEIATRLVGQIQNRKGHLYRVSQSILNAIFGDKAYEADDTRTVTLTLPSDGAHVDIRVDRMQDNFSVLASGFADFAIVSTGSYRIWKDAQGEACQKDPFEIIADLGYAGCKWMMMAPVENAQMDLRQALTKNHAEEPPLIVTSHAGELRDFLMRRGIDPDPFFANEQVVVQDGSTERYARYLIERTGRRVLIHDSVASGGTAFKHGFKPFEDAGFSEEEHKALLIAKRGAPERRGKHALFAAVRDNRSRIAKTLKDSYLKKLQAAMRDSDKVPEALRDDVRAFATRRMRELQASPDI